ncbi:hypothetical protein C7974DRAFT_307314 [Boeremia exigua]|uniref:uncharacterized protein n=1 Tax=Boeremia exigua TaxID=749465 RepID=UPI001E8D327F|nr:uncharacterized protein C7974DRAFT_307314 [Boeremia exigua]KAH6637539.1 hypothetical protein C7974DRAFT_307314 [Boeremia exigua]
MSQTAQAQVAIPIGIVREQRHVFEARISVHHYENDHVYIGRAARNLNRLARHGRTYAGYLRSVENATLFDLPQHLVSFLRDHDNLYRAAVRNRSVARKAMATPDMDVIEQVKHSLNNIRTAYYINVIETSNSITEAQRLQRDPVFVEEFNSCTHSLQDEIIRLLARLERLLPSLTKDPELENIGPDHDINDFGHELPLPTSTTPDPHADASHCCICLMPFTPSHPAFHISACAHTIGAPCLAHWLNSTARNANLCPHCRTPLCARRARRPKSMREPRAVVELLDRAFLVLGRMERLQEELFGRLRAEDYMKAVGDELNYRLFEGDVGFCLVCDGRMRGVWEVRRARWH